MAKSIYGNGGQGVVATTATALAPAIGFVTGPPLAAAAGVDDDQIAVNTITVENTGTTDGSTTSASYLQVRVTYVNGKTSHDTLVPGERLAYKSGFNHNDIGMIELWTLVPGSNTSAGAANVLAIVGVMVKD